LEEKTIQSAMEHEVSHFIFNRKLSDDQKVEWKSIFERTKKKKAVSQYAKANEHEYFAENWNCYHNGRKNLLQPEVVKYFDKLIGGFK
jgi:hypothetical protein